VAKDIYLTQQDSQRLRDYLQKHPASSGSSDAAYVQDLQAELERAQILKVEEMPGDVVTLHSKVKLVDLSTGEEEVYTLVYPEEANASSGLISILAPIGTAMLGYRAGDEFEWKVPRGSRKLRVKEVLYQPERSGDFHL
jgi:regulator of nucleoside diphosphate kinase